MHENRTNAFEEAGPVNELLLINGVSAGMRAMPIRKDVVE